MSRLHLICVRLHRQLDEKYSIRLPSQMSLDVELFVLKSADKLRIMAGHVLGIAALGRYMPKVTCCSKSLVITQGTRHR